MNLSNATSSAALWTVLQRAMMPKASAHATALKIEMTSLAALSTQHQKGCGTGRLAKRLNEESNPEKSLKRVAWKGRNFMIPLSDGFEVIKRVCIC